MRLVSSKPRRYAVLVAVMAVGALGPAAGCLERITGDPPELDPRFYEGRGPGSGQTAVGETLVPFADYEGEEVEIRGVIHSEHKLPLDLDLWAVDPDAPGNREHLGKVPLTLPGSFSLEVPRGFGGLQIEAFHDLETDGPSDDDPFATTTLEVGDEDMEGVDLTLEVGGRAAASLPPKAREAAAAAGEGGPGGPVHTEAPPGAPGGTPHPHGTGGEGQEEPVEHRAVTPEGGDPRPWERQDPFDGVPGERVSLSGTLHYPDQAVVVDLDVFRHDPNGPGGRAFAGKFKIVPGPFEISVPRSLGEVSLEAFLDPAGDGPSPGDPQVACPCNPIRLEEGDRDGIELRLSAPRGGREGSATE